MTRPLRVAVQMDPIESINIDGDSTFALMLEAQSRGYALWHYEVRHLSLKEGAVGRRVANGKSGCLLVGSRSGWRGGTARITNRAQWKRWTWAAWTWC